MSSRWWRQLFQRMKLSGRKQQVHFLSHILFLISKHLNIYNFPSRSTPLTDASTRRCTRSCGNTRRTGHRSGTPERTFSGRRRTAGTVARSCSASPSCTGCTRRDSGDPAGDDGGGGGGAGCGHGRGRVET